jgi:hypothetical protein
VAKINLPDGVKDLNVPGPEPVGKINHVDDGQRREK